MSSGTQSPPLELSDPDAIHPLGKSAPGAAPSKGVPDAQQRAEYFGNDEARSHVQEKAGDSIENAVKVAETSAARTTEMND